METKNKSARARDPGTSKRRSQYQRPLNSDKTDPVQDRNRFARHITITTFADVAVRDDGGALITGTKLTLSHFLDPKIEGVRSAGCTTNGWTNPQVGLTEAERKKLFAPLQNAEMRQKAGCLWLQQQLQPNVADIKWDRLVSIWQKYGHLKRTAAGQRCYRDIKRLAKRKEATQRFKRAKPNEPTKTELRLMFKQAWANAAAKTGDQSPVVEARHAGGSPELPDERVGRDGWKDWPPSNEPVRDKCFGAVVSP